MKRENVRSTAGILIALTALVFALTGAAVAAEKIVTNQIAKKAVTGPKIARDAVKSGKIRDGSVKARDFAEGVLPALSYGRVNKDGENVITVAGAEGIVGAADGGDGVICYDLATVPTSGSATVVHEDAAAPGSTVEMILRPNSGCPAPFNDARTVTKRSTNGALLDEDLYLQFVR